MMPVENRDFLQFTYQSPGAATPAPGSRLSTQANAGVNVSGAREAANNFLLDGVDNNDLFLNRLVVTPSLDAIQEFTLVQNTYDAEYRRNSGAQVNVVTQVGREPRARVALRVPGATRRSMREACSMPPTSPRRSSAGTSSAAPWAGRSPAPAASISRAPKGCGRAAPRPARAHVPTARERAGDFSASGVVLRDPLTGAAVSRATSIPADRLDPAGVNTAALYPDPNRAASPQNLVSSPPGSRDGLQLTRQDGSPRLARHPVLPPLQPHRRRSRAAVPGARPQPAGVRHLRARRRAQRGRRRLARCCRTAFFNEVRVGWNRLRRENAPLARGLDGFDALGIAGPLAAGGRHGILRRSCWPATRRSATIRTCRCRGARTPSTSATA